MLSLPAEWDFTIKGLTQINKEGISAIRAAIAELEESGYVIRTRIRNAAGQLIDTEYTIYEFPQNNTNDNKNTACISETSCMPSLYHLRAMPFKLICPLGISLAFAIAYQYMDCGY